MSEQELANGEHQDKENVDYKALYEKALESKERVLNESKKYKTRMSQVEELEAKLKAYEDQKLEEQGNWEERLRRESEQSSKLRARLEQQTEQIMQSNVFNAVANIAKDAHDISDLLAQSDSKIIEIDEETLKPIPETVERFYNSLKEKKKYLFKGNRVPPMGDEQPNGNRQPAEPPKSMKSMSIEERKTALRMELEKLNTARS